MKYHELNDSAKERAREWLLKCVQNGEWDAECVIEDWKKILDMLGFFNVEIFFTGFSGQGDGACFIGAWDVRYVNYAKLVKHIGVKNADEADHSGFFRMLNLLRGAEALGPHHINIKHRGHYYHEHSVRYDFDTPSLESDTVPDFEESFKEACRYLMRTIYQQIEAEYEYQCSDQALVECIECNQYDFDSDGNVSS